MIQLRRPIHIPRTGTVLCHYLCGPDLCITLAQRRYTGAMPGDYRRGLLLIRDVAEGRAVAIIDPRGGISAHMVEYPFGVPN